MKRSFILADGSTFYAPTTIRPEDRENGIPAWMLNTIVSMVCDAGFIDLCPSQDWQKAADYLVGIGLIRAEKTWVEKAAYVMTRYVSAV